MGYELKDLGRHAQAAAAREAAAGRPLPPEGTASERCLVGHLANAGISDYHRDSRVIRDKKIEADFSFSRTDIDPLGDIAEFSFLRVFIDGRAHMFEKAGDSLGGTGKGKRSRDCTRQNLIPLMCPQTTTLYFTPAQVGRMVALHSIQAWLEGDDKRLIEALQGKTCPNEA